MTLLINVHSLVFQAAAKELEKAEKAAKAEEAKAARAQKLAADKAARALKVADLKAKREAAALARKEAMALAKAKRLEKGPAKRKRKTDESEETSVSEVSASDESPKKKGKTTPGIPTKGFGARKVAVPGVSVEDIGGTSAVSDVDGNHSELEPEKEKTPREVSEIFVI